MKTICIDVSKRCANILSIVALFSGIAVCSVAGNMVNNSFDAPERKAASRSIKVELTDQVYGKVRLIARKRRESVESVIVELLENELC